MRKIVIVLLGVVVYFQTTNVSAQKTYDEQLLEANDILINGDQKTAIARLRSLAIQDTSRFETYSYLGIAYYKAHDLDSSLYFYNKAIQLKTGQPDLFFNRARIHVFKRNYKLALADLDKSIAVSADNSDYYLLQGFILEELKDYEKAIVSYRKAQSLNPELQDMYISIVIAQQKIELIKKKKNKLYKNIYDFLAQNKYEETIFECRKILKENPDDKSALLYSSLLKIAVGRSYEAILECNKLIQLEPKNKKYYYYRALAKMNMNQMPESSDDLRTYLSENKNDTLGHYLLAYTSYKEQNYEAAIIEYNTLLQLRPNDLVLLLNRGNVYILMGVFRNALDDFNKMVELQPSNPLGYLSRGLTYVKMNKFTDACKDFTTSSELGNQMAEEFSRQVCPTK